MFWLLLVGTLLIFSCENELVDFCLIRVGIKLKFVTFYFNKTNWI